jgi:hypothetical protein
MSALFKTSFDCLMRMFVGFSRRERVPDYFVTSVTVGQQKEYPLLIWSCLNRTDTFKVLMYISHKGNPSGN